MTKEIQVHKVCKGLPDRLVHKVLKAMLVYKAYKGLPARLDPPVQPVRQEPLR